MWRVINVLLVGAMVATAIVTYNLKHEAGEVAKKVTRLQNSIGREREAIALLKAEWSVVTQPARLQALVARYVDHFQLSPFTVSQVATLDEIPVRPEDAAAAETAVAVAPSPPVPTPRVAQ